MSIPTRTVPHARRLHPLICCTRSNLTTVDDGAGPFFPSYLTYIFLSPLLSPENHRPESQYTRRIDEPLRKKGDKLRRIFFRAGNLHTVPRSRLGAASSEPAVLRVVVNVAYDQILCISLVIQGDLPAGRLRCPTQHHLDLRYHLQSSCRSCDIPRRMTMFTRLLNEFVVQRAKLLGKYVDIFSVYWDQPM